MKKILSIFIILSSMVFVFAENTELSSDLDFSIRFYDRRVYYPGDNSSEPIFVRMEITNKGSTTLRFKLADDHAFSVDFIVIDTKNRYLKHSEQWLRKRNANRKVYFREVSLEPGETYSFIENLKDYMEIAKPGVYILQGLFFPELKNHSDNRDLNVASTRLSLEVKPSLGPGTLGMLPVNEETGAILEAMPIPPDQVITYLLTARQKSHWDQFFLYLNLEKLIQSNVSRGKRYKAESEMGRLRLIENYKQELRQERIDKDIAAIPVEFKIERTTYTDTEAEVRVIEWFSYKTFREKKRVTYYLSSRDGIWTVYEYVVENLGTE